MKILLDLFKVVIFSILLLLMLTVKAMKNFFGWVSARMDRFTTFGENGFDGEIAKLKTLIKDIVKKTYTKIVS